MTFEEVLNESVSMLQRQGCVSYRSVQHQFDLDDDYFADLKEALLYIYAEVGNDDGRGLVWTGEPSLTLPNAQPETESEILEHDRILCLYERPDIVIGLFVNRYAFGRSM